IGSEDKIIVTKSVETAMREMQQINPTPSSAPTDGRTLLKTPAVVVTPKRTARAQWPILGALGILVAVAIALALYLAKTPATPTAESKAVQPRQPPPMAQVA